MSSLSLLGGGPLGGDPFGGHSGFGFNVPQGDPGAIEGAASAVRSLGHAMTQQGHALRAAAGVALDTDGGWRGSASSAYAEISSHVAGVFGGDAGECESAAGALQTLAHELAHAQSVTKQALADCIRLQGEVTRQQGIAVTARLQAQAATARAASAAAHPATIAAFTHEAHVAGQQQSDAQQAAARAEGELKAAQMRGQLAYETYERVARDAGSRLTGAADAMRTAPAIAGGAPIPVSVTPADVTLAGAMIAGAGTIPTQGGALSNPARLGQLACGPVSPGAAVQFLKEYDERQQVARIAAADKPADGSFLGVIPGGPTAAKEVSQFGQGVFDTTKGTVAFATHPSQWKALVGTLLASSPAYRQVFDHEDPLTAQARATQTSEGVLKGVVDWQDFSHGRIAKGLGSLTAGALEAKGLKAASGLPVIRDVPSALRADPPGAAKLGMDGLGQVGVPHAGDFKDLAAYAANPEVRRMWGVYGVTAPGRIRQLSVAVLTSRAIAAQYPELIQRVTEQPVNPKVIVVPHPGSPLSRYTQVRLHAR
jgi:hypothetical protein